MNGSRSAAQINAGSTAIDARLSVPAPTFYPAPRSAESNAEEQTTQVRGLQLLGLPRREARLYLTLLKSGPMGAREATRAANLHRATGYRLLSRLLARGLVTGDGRWPQRFHPLPISVGLSRLRAFLRDEEELRRWTAVTYEEALGVPSNGVTPSTNGAPGGVQLVAWGPPTTSPLLRAIGQARHQIDVLLRPLSTPPSLRAPLARAFAKAAETGVTVRLVLDAAPSDFRFLDRVRREANGSGSKLEVRQFTPQAANLCLIDGRRGFRFPVSSVYSRIPEVGVTGGDTYFVRPQLARFEAIWGESVPVPAQLRSTRSYSWRVPGAELPRNS